MKDSWLLHVKIDEELKRDMQKLIELGMFSTEAEIAREAIRSLIVEDQ